MVPVVDLKRRGARFAAEFAVTAEAIARSGQFLLGPRLEAFEQAFRDVAHTDHVVGVASGASALHIALIAAGVEAGDDVIVPAFTAVPTASAVAALGARPIAADVDPLTACVTADAIEAARTPRTTAVIVVHLYGRPADVDLVHLADSGLIVIEDAAQAAGALDRPTVSSAVAYSFYPTKNLGGIGDGGAVATNDSDLAEQARRRRVHGMTEQYVHESISQNFRMSELEAAWLYQTMPTLEADNERRRAIVGRYRAAAPTLPWASDHPRHVHHLAVFRSTTRDDTRTRLDAAGVSTGVHYPLAITQQPGYRDLPHPPCPEAEAWARECISVPCFPEMTEAEIDQVCTALAAEATST